MDLSERKFINNSKQCLPKFTIGLDSYYNTARQELSRSIYNPTNISTKTLPDSTMRKVNPSPASQLSKSIYNPSTLPKTLPDSTMRKVNAATPNATQGLGKAGRYANAAVSALSFATDMINNAKPTVTAEELESTARPYTTDIDGIQTELYGSIDTSVADVDEAGSALSGAASGVATGAAIGSLFPGAGTAIGAVAGGIIGGVGGLFGASSKAEEHRKAVEQARLRISRKNKFNVETAQSKALKMRKAERYGDQEDQSLFHAAKGKEPDVNPSTGTTYKNYVVNTAQGKQTMPQNAWVSKGEVIKSADGNMYRVKEGKNDTARAYIRPGDTIYSKSVVNPETGNKIADDVELYDVLGILPRLDMNLKISRNNKLKKFGLGSEGYTNILSGVAGLLGAYKQYKDASQPLYTPSVGTENAYLGMIPKLMALRQDYYPLWKLNREIEARGRAATRASGGLSAGQKALAYANLYNNTQMNNAKALFDTQLANNLLKSRAYETALNVGNQDASRRQQANIFNTEMLAKAHNASLQGRQMAMYNGINALQNFFANQFKLKQFNDTMGLYRWDMNERRKDRK